MKNNSFQNKKKIKWKSLHLLCCNISLSLMKKENPASHDMQLGREECVNSLVRLSWLHQNSTSGRFLKISFNVEAATISFNFSFSVTLKFISQFYTLKGSVTQAWFQTSHMGSLENLSSLNHTNVPNHDTLCHITSKHHTQPHHQSHQKHHGTLQSCPAHSGESGSL